MHTHNEREDPIMFSRREALAGAAAIALLSLQIVSDPAVGHDGENGPNGGPMLEVGAHHLELTNSGRDLTLFLMDGSHAPLPSTGASGRVVVLEGSQQASLTLVAAEPNRLTAKLEKPLAAGARVVVTARLADGRSLTARFVWK